MKYVRCTKGCKGSTLRTRPGGREFNLRLAIVEARGF